MEAGDPRPMDPERLADIRECVEWRRDRPMPMDDDRDVIIAELLADRDYHAALAEKAGRLLVEEQQASRTALAELGATQARLAMGEREQEEAMRLAREVERAAGAASGVEALPELESAFKRLEANMRDLGEASDEASLKKRAQLFLEAAGYFGYLALVTMPDAKNYVVCSVRFDGAEDPAHSAIAFEARWQAGMTPGETISELKHQIERLETEWREMKSERDEARRQLREVSNG